MKKQLHNSVFEFLLNQNKGKPLFGPIPSKVDQDKMLKIALNLLCRDSSKIRFVSFKGKKKVTLASAVIDSIEFNSNCNMREIDKLQLISDFYSPPLKIIVVGEHSGKNTSPFSSNLLDAANAGMMVELVARALGYGARWETFQFPPGDQMRQLLMLNANEYPCGMVAIGYERD